MCTNEADVNSSYLKQNHGDNPVFVAFDVEYITVIAYIVRLLSFASKKFLVLLDPD